MKNLPRRGEEGGGGGGEGRVGERERGIEREGGRDHKHTKAADSRMLTFECQIPLLVRRYSLCH